MNKGENSLNSNAPATLRAHRKKTRKVLSSLLNHRGISHRKMVNIDETDGNLQESSGDLTNRRLKDALPKLEPTHSQKMWQYLKQEVDNSHLLEVEDGRLTTFLLNRLMVADLACTILYMIGLCFAIVAYDVNYVASGGYTTSEISLDRSEANVVKVILLSLVFVSTTLLWPLIGIRYHFKLKYYQARGETRYDAKIYHHPHILSMGIELLFASLHPSPFLVDFYFENMNDVTGLMTKYGINDILSMLMLFRAFAILRIFITNSTYYGNSAKRICGIYGCPNNYAYVLKCLMHRHPLQIIVGTMVTMIFLFGYALKISERPLVDAIRKNDPASWSFNTDISNYNNAIWCMVVTMTTVGYGDFVPRTMPGRMLGFIICIYGVTGVSLMVLTLQNILTLDFKENRALLQAERVAMLMQRRTYAARVISKVAKFNYMKNHSKDLSKENINYFIKGLKFELGRLKSVQKKLDLYQNRLSFEEELNRQFFFLKDQFSDVKEKILICSELQNVLFDCMELEAKNQVFGNVEKKTPDKMMPFSNDSSFIDSFTEKEAHSTKKKAPLLAHFMREKRKSDYKLNTERLRSPIYNKVYKREEENSQIQKKAKEFINKRKSMIMDQN